MLFSYRQVDAGPVEFRLLGSIEASVDGAVVPLGGRRQCALLALLLIEPGRPVATETLAEELWQGRPPDGARTTLRSYVSRLRRRLGDSVVLTGGGDAYSLQIALEAVDVHRFERLLQEGSEALARGAAARAAQRLREALALWRGRPFADVGGEGMLGLEAERLEELRLLALERRIEAELALGRSAELVDELEPLVRRHPYRERLWQQLMLALYRAERQADALDAYRRARAVLVEELGLEPGDQLKELEQAILRHEVPPFRPPAERHNLPAPLTRFVGRVAELAQVESLLSESRLVTLTGVGGVGKTRLALEAAARALPDLPDGAFFCDLALLSEPALVVRAVARAFDLRERAQVAIADALVQRLRDAELLLLLDNCEHLRDTCAELAQTLLSSCPRLRILATSREALRVPGEVDYPVPPLALLPTAGDPEEIVASDAVSLLLTRARESRPSLAADPAALVAAASICVELDGLPLAIELAAARAKTLTLEEIATHLADRFRFLVSWRRLTPARHRTLRESMDWSYALLSEDDRALLARLAAFSGGFTLEAAAAVCLEADEERALEPVERLVEGSLVVAEPCGGTTRYRLLETVRQYAREKLEERGEKAELERRHAAHVLGFAEASRSVQDDALSSWAVRMDRERGNLRAALAWSRDAGEAEHLLRLTASVWRFWWIGGDLSEGRSWLDAALERGAGADPALLAAVLEGTAGLAWAQGDLDRARVHAEAALPLFTEAGDSRGEQAALIVLGHVALHGGDFRAAESLFERSRRLAEQHGPDSNVAVATHNLASVAFGEGDLERAARLYESARDRYRANDDAYGIALSELYLGLVAVEHGRRADAAGHLGRALPVFQGMRFLQYTAQCLEGIAAVARGRGDPREAARLLAAASALRERTGEAPTVAARLRERELAATLAELGEDGFAAASAEGVAFAEDEAIDRAQAVVG